MEVTECRVTSLLRRAFQTFLMLLMLSSGFFLAIAATPVRAGTFDGTYDYAYNMRGPDGWETHRVPSGFIVSNGRISSNPSALSGTVDSSGNAQFEGPCPYGCGTSVFTGAIESDGSGEGTYQCQHELGGRWAVTRVSGGGLSDLDEIIDSILGFFEGIGELFGLSGSTAAAVGVAAVLVPVITIVSIAQTRSAVAKQKTEASRAMERRRPERPSKVGYRRDTGYTASQPAPPPTPPPQEAPPPIDSSSAQPIGGVGVHQGPLPLPSALDVRATWTEGQVTLNWNQPQFDASMYRLDEYIVSRMQYGPTSTAVQKVPLARLSPQNTQWVESFNQSYRWNTGGDIEGYTVEAVLRRISSTGHLETFRVGGMAYTPPA
jgi:hypothetical protein